MKTNNWQHRIKKRIDTNAKFVMLWQGIAKHSKTWKNARIVKSLQPEWLRAICLRWKKTEGQTQPLDYDRTAER